MKIHIIKINPGIIPLLTIIFSFSEFALCSQSLDTNGVAGFRVGNKWGIIDHHGNMVSAPKYDKLSFYKNSGTYVINEKYGLLQADGKELTEAVYEYIEPRSYYGLRAFQQEGKWGYLDNNGSIKIPAQYDLTNHFSDDRTVVTIGDDDFLIDREGKTIVQLEGLHYVIYNADSIYVARDSSTLLIDHEGKVVKKYPFSTYWIDGTYMTIHSSYYERNIKKGLADMNGQILLPIEYQKIEPDSDLIFVTKNGLSGFVNKYNKSVIPLGKYEYVDIFRENNFYTEYRKSGKSGFVNRSGKEIGNEFEQTRRFLLGAADVKQNGKWGSIDTTGRLIIPCRYDFIYSLGNNLFCIQKRGKFSLIDRQQKPVSKKKFQACMVGGLSTINSSTLIIVKKRNKYGVIDLNGNYVVKPAYDEIGYYSWS